MQFFKIMKTNKFHGHHLLIRKHVHKHLGRTKIICPRDNMAEHRAISTTYGGPPCQIECHVGEGHKNPISMAVHHVKIYLAWRSAMRSAMRECHEGPPCHGGNLVFVSNVRKNLPHGGPPRPIFGKVWDPKSDMVGHHGRVIRPFVPSPLEGLIRLPSSVPSQKRIKKIYFSITKN